MFGFSKVLSVSLFFLCFANQLQALSWSAFKDSFLLCDSDIYVDNDCGSSKGKGKLKKEFNKMDDEVADVIDKITDDYIKLAHEKLEEENAKNHINITELLKIEALQKKEILFNQKKLNQLQNIYSTLLLTKGKK